jgi:hypothetical protein
MEATTKTKALKNPRSSAAKKAAAGSDLTSVPKKKAAPAKKATTKRPPAVQQAATSKARVNLMLNADEQRALQAIAPGEPINAELLHQILSEALPLILAQRDAADYKAAYEEWADSGEAEAWDVTAGDGISG